MRTLYARLGSRVVIVAIVVAFALSLGLGATSGIGLSRYLGLSAAQTVSWLALSAPVTFLATLLGLIPARRQLRTMLDWSGPGRVAANAPTTWRALVRVPAIVTVCGATTSIAILLALIYITVHFGQPWWALVPLLAWGALLVTAMWTVVVYAARLILRPMLADVADHFPEGFGPDDSRRYARIETLPLPVVTAFAMLIVGAFTDLASTGPARLTIALGLSLGVIALASLVFTAVARSVLDPVDDLIEGSDRVRAGRLEEPVPVTGNDPLGTLAHGFNQLLAALRERQALDAELQRSRVRIATAADAGRQAVERDLRGGAAGHLERALALSEQFRSGPGGGDAIDAPLHAIEQQLELALTETRELAHGIYPAQLEHEGLAAALIELGRRERVSVAVDLHRRLPSELEAGIYFCCVEGLHQATAGARVHVIDRGDSISLEIAGAPPPAQLQTVGDRVGAMGGELRLQPGDGGRSSLLATVPVGGPQDATPQPERDAAPSLSGSRLLLSALAAGTGAGLLTGLVGTVTLAQYLHLPAGRYLVLLSIWVPVVLALELLGFRLSRAQLRPILTWPQADSEATWMALTRLPVVVARASALASVGIAGGVVTVVVGFHEPAWLLIAAEGSALILALAICVIATFTIETVMRPMLEAVARRLPDGFAPPAGGFGFRARMLAPLPVVAVYGTFAVGAFTNESHSGATRLTIALGVTLAAISLAAVLFGSISRTSLAPLQTLIAATSRLRAGEVDLRVPVLSRDELGRLAVNFNAMIAGLRERQSLRDQIRGSLVRIVATADLERRRIERNLHDGAQQQLVLLRLKLGLARRAAASDPGRAMQLVGELEAQIASALAELHTLAAGVYPPALESGGLRVALKDAVQQAAVPARVDCNGLRRHDPDVEAAVYFCCLEALQNVAKYAGSGARAVVRLSDHDGTLRFEVTDDGRGFVVTGTGTGAGLQNMTDRIGTVGGTVQITSSPGLGTVVAGIVPLEAP